MRWPPKAHISGFNHEGNLVPTEFKYTKEECLQIGPRELAFGAALKHFLEALNAQHVFGICQYPGDDFQGTCEITKDKANTNLDPNDVCKSFCWISTTDQTH
jgi:hypothetical protein